MKKSIGLFIAFIFMTIPALADIPVYESKKSIRYDYDSDAYSKQDQISDNLQRAHDFATYDQYGLERGRDTSIGGTSRGKRLLGE